MTNHFAWVSDVSRGEWLRPVEAEPFGSILSVVPRGFEAYARIFHPLSRDRLTESEPITWANTAKCFGTVMHSEAQFAKLVRMQHGAAHSAVDADGWHYSEPFEGSLAPAALAATATILARHTSTPQAGVAAIWAGWGGLMSSAGIGVALLFSPQIGHPSRYRAALPPHFLGLFFRRLALHVQRIRMHISSRIRFRLWFSQRTAELGSGLLSREIATGKRFDLHGETG